VQPKGSGLDLLVLGSLDSLKEKIIPKKLSISHFLSDEVAVNGIKRKTITGINVWCYLFIMPLHLAAAIGLAHSDTIRTPKASGKKKLLIRNGVNGASLCLKFLGDCRNKSLCAHAVIDLALF